MIAEYITEQEKSFLYAGKILPILYREYLDYLRTVKGLARGTIHNRKKPILLFLMKYPHFAHPSGIAKLKPEHVHRHVMEQAKTLPRAGKHNLTTAFRDFLRFLHLKNYIRRDLSGLVPTLIAYRLSTLHRGLEWPVVRKLLRVPNRRTHTGRRNFAILLMLARYGIRQGQLIELRMSDIDWKKQTIHFKAVKGGKDILVPLFPDVAKALVAYFKGGRMKASEKFDHVFLTLGNGGSAIDGQRPLGRAIWYMVHRCLAQIGIDRACKFPRGPHSIRHAFATKLLSEKKSIKVISDLLGHRSIKTTYIYTKSDIKRLRELCVRWPERRSS